MASSHFVEDAGMSVDISSGAAGIVVGFALKFGADVWTMSKQERRQDVVWRRERLTDSAAELLRTCIDATKANGWVVRCVEELTNAGRGAHDESVVPAYQTRLNEAYEEARLRAEAMDRALQAVILYAGVESRAAAVKLVEVTKEHPTMSEVMSGPFHNHAAAERFRETVMADSALR